MAISAALLDSLASGTDAASYTTASITPTANALQLLSVTNSKGTASDVPTVTGCGLTWVEVGASFAWSAGGFNWRLTVFRALGASPTTGQLTIDFAGATQTGIRYIWQEYTGTDTSGTNGSGAVVQTATAPASPPAASTSLTVTLAAFGDATNNAAFICAGHQANEVSAEEGGYTELGDVATSVPVGALAAAWKLAEDLSPSYSWVTSSNAGARAIEVKAAGGAPP